MIVVNNTGRNIGSAYEIVGGFAWNVVATVEGKIDFRRGREASLAKAGQALLKGAREMVPDAVIEP